MQNLATAVDNYFGAWTGFSHGTAGFAWSNVSGGTLTGRYRTIGKLVFVHLAITAGTAAAAGIIGINLPTAMPASLAGQVYPIPCLLTVGGVQTTTVSARLENGSRSISFYASTAGGNFTLGQACTLSTNFTYEAA